MFTKEQKPPFSGFSASVPWGLFKSIWSFFCVLLGRQGSRSCGYFNAKMRGSRRTAKSDRSKAALTLLSDRNSAGTSWIWRGPASGRGGSAHRVRSGRLEPRGGLPLRHLGLGAVPPPQHGAAAEPAERLLRSQLKVRARCASPARPSPCHAAYTKQAPPEPCLYK